jgi:streptogramin lyase
MRKRPDPHSTSPRTECSWRTCGASEREGPVSPVTDGRREPGIFQDIVARSWAWRRGRWSCVAVGVALLATAVSLAVTASVSTAAVGEITEFSDGLDQEGSPQSMTSGPDGQLWFTSSVNAAPNTVGRITTTGSITEFPAPSDYVPVESIARGPDGNLWVTDPTKAINRVTLTGEWTEFSDGPRVELRPFSIARGPDGNLWFTVQGGEPRAIGRITPTGQITEYLVGLNAGSFPYGITAGPDGNVWFTDAGTTPAIGRITPSGQITEFAAGLGPGSVIERIAQGPDGNLWFTNRGTQAIGRITPTGEITEFTEGLGPNSRPKGITPGPDGNLWFTDRGSVSSTRAIGRITPAGQITEWRTGLNEQTFPELITSGADGNVWFTDSGFTPAIGRIFTGQPPAVQQPPTLEGAPKSAALFVVKGRNGQRGPSETRPPTVRAKLRQGCSGCAMARLSQEP